MDSWVSCFAECTKCRTCFNALIDVITCNNLRHLYLSLFPFINWELGKPVDIYKWILSTSWILRKHLSQWSVSAAPALHDQLRIPCVCVVCWWHCSHTALGWLGIIHIHWLIVYATRSAYKTHLQGIRCSRLLSYTSRVWGITLLFILIGCKLVAKLWDAKSLQAGLMTWLEFFICLDFAL